jgi:hypothetical protein
MAGTTANAALWQNADVYIADVGATAPTDVSSTWDASWEAAGLLNGEDGFVMSRDEEVAEHFAWGGVLVKKTRRNHKRTVQFTALEDNPVVFRLINPGSSAPVTQSGLTTSVVKVPVVEEFAIGFEVRDGNKIKRRTVKRATLEEVGEVTESESGLASVQITVVILTEEDGELYREVSGTVS